MHLPENTFTMHVPLRWSDMDAYGHINNVQYVRLLEEARIQAFAHWFGSGRAVVDGGVLVARCEIEYRQPLVHRPAPLPIAMWVTKIGRSSYDIAYVLYDPKSDDRSQIGAVYAIAETTMVTYDFENARPRAISDADREALSKFTGPGAPMRGRTEATK